MATHTHKEFIRLHKNNENGEMGSGQNNATLFPTRRYPEGGIRSFKKGKNKTQKESHKTTPERSLQIDTARDTKGLVCIPGNTRNTPQRFSRHPGRNENPDKQGTFPRILTGLITFYQKAISIYLPHTCRFEPTCSEYTKQAIIKFGPLKGVVKGFLRILRCNPLFPGGYDPV